jgi:hypothetical protein
LPPRCCRRARRRTGTDEGHTTFPGGHAYFHNADGNGIEIIDLYKK